MSRDDFSCAVCHNDSETLNVHHRWYVRGRKPWEYAPDALVTLCEECHAYATGQQDRLCEALSRLDLSHFRSVTEFAESLLNQEKVHITRAPTRIEKPSECQSKQSEPELHGMTRSQFDALLHEVAEIRLSTSTFLSKIRSISNVDGLIVIQTHERDKFLHAALCSSDNQRIIHDAATAVFDSAVMVSVAGPYYNA
jgi:hypothetical protein